MAATYPYVGVRADRTRAVFRTMRAARRMAGNNTVPSVALAERYAAHIAATGVYPDGSAA